jgi:hypothetical protein
VCGKPGVACVSYRDYIASNPQLAVTAKVGG